jgi:hypothetical protein
MGAVADVIEIPWGRAIDATLIEKQLNAADYRAVVVVHNESSTGVASDLASIGAVVRNSAALLIVDSVSGLGGIEMRQDEWGIDIVASASQKALMCPPGIGLASMSPKAWNIVNRDSGSPRYYWDFRKAAPAVERSETPFTAPVSLAVGLREALAMIDEEGMPRVLARHRRLSSALPPAIFSPICCTLERRLAPSGRRPRRMRAFSPRRASSSRRRQAKQWRVRSDFEFVPHGPGRTPRYWSNSEPLRVRKSPTQCRAWVRWTPALSQFGHRRA